MTLTFVREQEVVVEGSTTRSGRQYTFCFADYGKKIAVLKFEDQDSKKGWAILHKVPAPVLQDWSSKPGFTFRD